MWTQLELNKDVVGLYVVMITLAYSNDVTKTCRDFIDVVTWTAPLLVINQPSPSSSSTEWRWLVATLVGPTISGTSVSSPLSWTSPPALQAAVYAVALLLHGFHRAQLSITITGSW